MVGGRPASSWRNSEPQGKIFSGSTAFDLESTYGFPIDLTELMASEFGLSVDKEE